MSFLVRSPSSNATFFEGSTQHVPTDVHHSPSSSSNATLLVTQNSTRERNQGNSPELTRVHRYIPADRRPKEGEVNSRRCHAESQELIQPQELLKRIDRALRGDGVQSPLGTLSPRGPAILSERSSADGAQYGATYSTALASAPTSEPVVAAWKRRADATIALVLVLRRVHVRMSYSVFRAMDRMCVRSERLEIRSQLGGVIQPLLLRKVKAFALRIASLFRRNQALLKFHGMHTWRHFCLKGAAVSCQSNMLRLISEQQEEAHRCRAEVAREVEETKLVEAVGHSNRWLQTELRRQFGFLRCSEVIAHAVSRSLRSALEQLRLYSLVRETSRVTHQRASCMVVHASLRRPIRRQLSWALQRWMEVGEYSRARQALEAGLVHREAVRRSDGLPAIGLAPVR